MACYKVTNRTLSRWHTVRTTQHVGKTWRNTCGAKKTHTKKKRRRRNFFLTYFYVPRMTFPCTKTSKINPKNRLRRWKFHFLKTLEKLQRELCNLKMTPPFVKLCNLKMSPLVIFKKLQRSFSKGIFAIFFQTLFHVIRGLILYNSSKTSATWMWPCKCYSNTFFLDLQ